LGQKNVIDTYHTEEIDIELALCLLGFGELDCTGDAKTGIVDHNVDVILRF